MSRTLRSRKGIGAGAMVALCLAAASAVAQDRPVTTRQDRADTVKVNVSGRVDLDYVVRERTLNEIPGMDRFGDDGTVDTGEGEVAIRIDAELSEKVSAVIEFARLRVDENAGGVVPLLGRFGDVENDVILREAHLKVVDFMAQGLTAKLGIIDWSFGARPNASLAFAPHWAQIISRNSGDGQDAATGAGSMAARYGINNAEELEPVGAHVAYGSGSLTLDFVLLPIMDEDGESSDDEALYAVDFWYAMEQMGKGSRIGAILALHNMSDAVGIAGVTGSGGPMITFGAAANLMFQQINVYAEGYLQRGTVGRDGAGNELDAEGHAFQVGARYTAEGDNAFWIELNFTLYSGDDSDTAPFDEEQGQFLSYENVNDFLIIEDMYFGLDVDTNYTAFKIMGGAAFDMAGGKKNVELQAGIGFFTTTEDVSTTPGNTDDALGTEIDVKGTYHLNKQASILLQLGFLTGSDLLEEMSGGTASDDSDDSTWLMSLGFRVRI